MSDKVSAEKRAELLVDHYQKSFELTHEMWKQRNLMFLRLLATIGLAALFAFVPQLSNWLLINYIAKATDSQAQELLSGFPFGLLQTIIMFVVFYLMVNLHHRAQYVLRSYKYLGDLESEIRELLNLGPEHAAFTRESGYYWQHRGRFAGLVKWIYFVLLGGLLMTFLTVQLVFDAREGDIGLLLADGAIAIAILIFFYAYTRSSVIEDGADEHREEMPE